LVARDMGAPVCELMREWLDQAAIKLGYRVEDVQKMLKNGHDSDQILAHFMQKKADQS
jgi:hypothetical protein